MTLAILNARAGCPWNLIVQNTKEFFPFTSENLFRVFSHRHVWIPPIVIATFLIVVSVKNYLLFHTLAELVAVMVAILIYVMAWQTHRFSHNNFFLFIACGYFWIGIMDLVHALSYKGVNIFPITDSNPATQIWIASRYCEALLLLAAPLLFDRTVNRKILFAGFGVVTAIIFTLVIYGFFPDAFIEGVGLTPFKINSEYIIIAILIAALAHMILHRPQMESDVLLLFAAVIILTIGAELAFTHYVSVYGPANLTGHIFKIFSYWLLFMAVVRSKLLKPYLELEKEVAERTMIESALKESELQLNSILSTAPEAIVTIDQNNRIIVFNNGAERIFGYESKNVIGRSVDMLLPEVVRNIHHKHIEEFTSSGESYLQMERSGAISGLRKDGTEFPASASVSWFIFNEKKIFTVMLRDISDLKRTEKQLIQSSKLASLGEMATGTAHEIKQPLNIIRMTTDTLIEMLAEGEALTPNFLKTKLERITSQIERATNIIDRMRIFGRNPAEYATEVSPQDAVMGAVSHLSEQLRLDEIELELDIPETCRHVMGDLVKIEQVILNLLINAHDAIMDKAERITAGEGPKRITLTMEDDPAANVIKVIVKDTGGGIPQDALPKLFDPFFTTKEIGKGTGIGLSISYSIVAEMGGAITVMNADGGAVFTVTLPVADEEPDQD